MAFRSCLAVPATNEHLISKAAGSPADQVLIDLEDSVPASDKQAARDCVRAVLDRVDFGSRAVTIRVNSVDSGLLTRDVVDLVGACADRLYSVVVPKVRTPAELRYVDQLIRDVTAEAGRADAVRIDVLLETAGGLADAHRILHASARVGAAVFGINGYVAELGLDLTHGADDNDLTGWSVPTGVLGWALGQVANAAAACGLRAFAGPSRERRDEAAYIAETAYLRRAGYSGRWCIHPTQVEWTNEVFSVAHDEA